MASISQSWLCLLLAVPSLAHMEMSWPYPFRSKFNPDNDSNDIDYSMTSPLLKDGSNFPCKGYQNDDNVQTTAVYTAGSTYNMTLAGSATHDGGSCQMSLSYDNAATFRVIKSMIGGCPLTSTYDFTIPSYAPAGQALLAWTWQNEEGNREYYMNCAAVEIVGASTRRRRKRATDKFDSLPYIWKANLDGINDCATVEGDDPVYPDAGPDVLYGGKMSSSSPATSGTCDSPTPYGQTYKRAAGDTSDPSTYSAASEPDTDSSSTTNNESSTTPAAEIDSTTTEPPSSTHSSPSQTTPPPVFAAKHAGFSGYINSTTTITTDCQSTVFLTITATRSTRTVLPTGMTTSSPTSNSHPPYVGSNANTYLPCVPGTFICANASTWLTCTSNDGSGSSAQENVYLYPRPVAAGMECLPSYSTYGSSTSESAQQANVPSGSYRDDRIVRARPDGDCDTDGSLQCTNGGQGFEVCDQGGWVDMGSVATGTVCRDGSIVAA